MGRAYAFEELVKIAEELFAGTKFMR